MIGLVSGAPAFELGIAFVRQGLLLLWSLAANFSVGMTLYLTRETGLLDWALDAQRLEPRLSTSLLLIGGGFAFGSVVLAVTGRLVDRLHPIGQTILHLLLGIWTLIYFVRSNATAWFSDDGNYEAYTSTWFFVGWAITQFAAAWLLVDSEADDAATSSA